MSDRALPIDPETRRAIDEVYRVFSRYPLPTAWDAAPGENCEHRLAVLSSAPLKKLTGDQLGPYADGALLTIGGVDDYRHFLPRIIELAALGCGNWMGLDVPIVTCRLEYGHWRNWPKDEQAALIEVFLAAFESALHQRPHVGLDAEPWLCGLAVLGEDISPLLARWASSTDPNAALQAASFLCYEPSRLLGSSDNAAYWSYAEARAWSALGAWAFSEDVASLLRSALSVSTLDDRGEIERALVALCA